ncbi:MAG: trypsin-like serine protease [Eubacterium sp.]|nr:trypsin-like serine protease [Eubacterium sp.]
MQGYQNEEGYYSYGETDSTCGAEDGLYQPYEEPQDLQKPKKQGGMGAKLMKCVALGLTFGVVAATSFAGTNHFFAGVTSEDTTASDGEEVLSGGDLDIAEGTETIDRISSRPEGVIEGTAGGAVTDVSGIVDEVMPSIVSITTVAMTQVPDFFFGQMQEEVEGCGSGIIVSQDEENLYIATNNHVIERAKTLTVLFADGSSVGAQIKGTDPSSDLAVVSVALSNIDEETRKSVRTATFGDSSTLQTGQMAIAIGNALGYGQSVTTGVISALNREVVVTNETDGSTITNELLQTDAAINPGNSGGALLNARGEVIGINSVKYSETSVEGMGYAIPSGAAIPIIRQLITREIVTGPKTAYLGISGVDVTQSMSETYNMPLGFFVTQVVENSGAADAGLMQGDIITRFDGRNIKSMDEIQELMKYLSVGSVVEVTVERAQNGSYVEQVLEITLGAKR